MELGAAVLGLAVLSRLASRFSFSAIPFYLLAGLVFGKGGLAPVDLSKGFIELAAEIGVLLLLFMLGLEYTGEQLRDNLRGGFHAGVIDLLLNFPPGLIAGLLLGWSPLAAVLLGGVTYISSSGVVAKILGEFNRGASPETPAILAVLVIEDLAMAVYLPTVAVLLAGGDWMTISRSVLIAVAAVAVALLCAIRFGGSISRTFGHESDEVILLTTFGSMLLVAAGAQRLQVSAAIGAFLVGIAVSGPMAHRSNRLLAPLRDLFAAIFFFFFGLEIDPATLPPVLPLASLLAVITTATKLATGIWAGRLAGVSRASGWSAGMALVARGEFSIVIAGLGVSIEPLIGPLAAAYVLLMAVLGPLLVRLRWGKPMPRFKDRSAAI